MIVLDRSTYTSKKKEFPFDITGKNLSSIDIDPNLIRTSPRVFEIMHSPNISAESKLKLLELLGYGKKDGKLSIINDNLQTVLGNVVKDLKQY